MGRPRSNDDGGVTLETVIVVPVLLTAVLLAINAALWYHARSIALASAQEGVRVARAYQSSDDGSATALSFARSTGSGFLNAPAVDTGGSTADTVVVRVSGKAVSLVPGLKLEITQVARGPREKFTTPTGRPTASPGAR